MITIALVDDDAMVRTGLRLIIGGDPELSIVGEASNGQEALSLIATTAPEVVLLDIRMPELDGLALLAQIAQSQSSESPSAPKVIILTTYHTSANVVQALRDGAAGFLLKDAEPAEMIAAIKAVHRGEPVLSPAVTGTLITAATQANPPAPAQPSIDLTEREREVAVLMAQGKTNAEIASELFMSVATVKAHLGRIFGRLGVDNRVAAAMAIRDAGLLAD